MSAEQMRRIDQIAAEVFGLQVPQMMEKAGRNLVITVLKTGRHENVVVLTGGGGNGADGLCCVQHLRKHGISV